MEVRLPPLGEGADSGSVAGIFIKVGDKVVKDQPILELESEKAVASIPSPTSGVVMEIHVRGGDEVRVGQIIVTLEEDDIPTRSGKRGDTSEQPMSVAPTGRLVKEPAPPVAVSRGAMIAGIPLPAAPSVRRLARELGIDLAKVRGSGRGGRIVMDDLRQYIQSLQQTASRGSGAPFAHITPAPKSGQAQGIDFSRWGSVSRKKLSTLRQAIGRKMVESWTSIPHVTQFDDLDITDIERLRLIYDPFYKKKGAHLTLTPFIIKALVSVLKKYPVFNSSLDVAANEVVLKDYYHIGIAVDTEQGLMVPVIREVEKKSILELCIDLKSLAERARQRKLGMEEMQGGSFTISNQGAIGGRHFTPIINSPEVAILGVGRGSEQAVARKLRIEKRVLLPVALSYDHRLIDGADAARFIMALHEQVAGFKDSDVRLEQ